MITALAWFAGVMGMVFLVVSVRRYPDPHTPLTHVLSLWFAGLFLLSTGAVTLA